MKKFPIISFLSLLIFMSSCKKDEPSTPAPTSPSTVAEKNEVITKNEWMIADVIFHMEYEYSFGGESINYDTTYSAMNGVEPCEKDMSFFFRPTSAFEIVEGPSYCGGDDSTGMPEDYKWKTEDNFGKLLIIGKDAGGIMQVTGGGSETSLGDTLTMSVLEINNSQLKTLYQVPLADVYEEAGFTEEMMKEFGVVFSGKSEVTYIWKKK